MTDYNFGESYFTMSYEQDGKIVGTLEYGEYDGKPNVKMIEVSKEYRRQGIAAKLLQELQRKYPDQEIDFGMTTDDGTKLLNAITYDVTDKNIVSDMQKLKNLQNKLNDLQEKLDNLYDIENPTDNQISEMEKVGDEWQEVYESIRELESELKGKKVIKTYVNTQNFGDEKFSAGMLEQLRYNPEDYTKRLLKNCKIPVNAENVKYYSDKLKAVTKLYNKGAPSKADYQYALKELSKRSI